MASSSGITKSSAAFTSGGVKSANSRQSRGEPMVDDLALLSSKIKQLLQQIEDENAVHIQEKLESAVANLSLLADSIEDDARKSGSSAGGDHDMLFVRMKNPLQEIVPGEGAVNPDDSNYGEVALHVTAKLPHVEKIPPFTIWKHLTRNQIMSEFQAGDDMHIDDLEEFAPAEHKYEFSKAEKRIIRMVSQDYEPSNEVLQILTQFIGGTKSEIHEVFKLFKKEDEEAISRNAMGDHNMNMLSEKSLASNLDTFDKFSQIFDCKLHGNSQPVIPSAERIPYIVEPQEDEGPCGDHCYMKLQAVTDNTVTWKPLEKDLFLKGLEMFGKNSCFIARNLLFGLKTCMQAYTYMHKGGPTHVSSATGPTHVSSATGPTRVSLSTVTHHKDEKRGSLRRKGKAKKHKQSWKSGGHAPSWRGIANGNQSNKQYTPCECNPMCGKECSCLKNSTCCEKYCGCSRSCKNRFRGCHCAKSQCRSQQCPCFAAGRECDPDLCRNCWVSCGGGLLGEPPRRGEGQCGNMRLLLRQQQKILLGISDVAGWGAFVKNSVEKDEYLGEYTGELISQEEADRRGKIYDSKNLSFLFNLNDEYVVDALYGGNKLKFANHSANPNCYAKIIKVLGDHRVGIFAKHPIQAGEEIFYDYCYRHEHAPVWARKPEDPKEGPSAPPQARAKKQPSHH